MLTLPLYPTRPHLAVETTEPRDLDSNCTACSLSNKVRTVCMPAVGDPGGLWIVGQGPGDHEDRQGQPFVGASGNYLRGLVEKYWHYPVVYDNALRCAPGNRPTTDKMINACRPYLAAILRDCRPMRIIALGGDAITGLVGRSWPMISTRRGYTYLLSDPPVPVFFILHPAAAMRNRFVRAWFESDLEWALTADDPPMPPIDGSYSLITTPQESQEACEDLALYKWITFDFETYGRMYDREFRGLGLSISPEGQDFAYLWDEQALANPEVLAPVCRLLESPIDKVEKGGQNIKYDIQAAERLGIKVQGISFDTRLWRKLLQADALAGLDAMQPLIGMGGGKDDAGELVKATKTEIKKLISKPETPPKLLQSLSFEERAQICQRVVNGVDPTWFAFAGVHPTVRDPYCALDSISTGKLKVHLEPLLRAEPGLKMIWEEISLPLAHAIRVMEQNGIAISQPKVRELQQSMSEIIEEQKEIFELYGLENAGSTKQVAKILFEELKLPIYKRTATNAASTDEESLSPLKHPLAKAIVKWRRATNFKTKYADAMIECLQDDGRIHPNILIDGTENARASCNSPNLFAIPRPEHPDGKLCRDIFIAEPGWVLIEGDYSQIELRIAAGLSGDPVMVGLYQDPDLDFHLATARMIAPAFKLNPDDITKDHWLRSQAKIVNFSIIYGKEAATLAVELNIQKKQAQQLIDTILGKFSRYKQWVRERIQFARRNGYCRSWWNGQDARIRPLWRIDDKDREAASNAERSSYNSPVQSTAAEFMNASLGQLQQWLEREQVPAKLVLTVYDSVLIEARQDVDDLVARKMKQIMEGHKSPSDVPILADLKKGTSWGSMSKVRLG